MVTIVNHHHVCRYCCSMTPCAWPCKLQDLHRADDFVVAESYSMCPKCALRPVIELGLENPMQHIYNGNISWLAEQTIFLTRYGSHAYGTAAPGSDVDLRGVCVAPSDVRLGFLDKFEMTNGGAPSGFDLEVHDLPRFMHGCAEAQPNMLEVLFTDPSDHLRGTYTMDMLMERRQEFLSTKARHSFFGFAFNQYKRMAYSQENDPRRPIGKRAMHIVRLIRMAREMVQDGQCIVRRPDAESLLRIREEGWPGGMESLYAWMLEQERQVKELEAKSPLPKEPNRRELNALCVDLLKRCI